MHSGNCISVDNKAIQSMQFFGTLALSSPPPRIRGCAGDGHKSRHLLKPKQKHTHTHLVAVCMHAVFEKSARDCSASVNGSISISLATPFARSFAVAMMFRPRWINVEKEKNNNNRNCTCLHCNYCSVINQINASRFALLQIWKFCEIDYNW